MSIANPPSMTTEELMALPSDGIDRDLIRGQLRERPMTRRSRPHSRTEASIAYILKRWLDSQPHPHGEVLSGEAGVRLARSPDSTVGIDVAYVSAEVLAHTDPHAFLVEGPPVLAVEILSPSDTQEDILAKIDVYLEAGVKLVWVVEPIYRTVTVYRRDAEPELFNTTQSLSGEPHLPGLRFPVRDIFPA